MELEIELKYNNEKYTAQANFMPDMVLYDVFKDNQRLFSMVLNEFAEWESDEDIDQSLVKALGYQIESINE